jgi:hypothetical protein
MTSKEKEEKLMRESIIRTNKWRNIEREVRARPFNKKEKKQIAEEVELCVPRWTLYMIEEFRKTLY